jgi:hypothetical protein
LELPALPAETPGNGWAARLRSLSDQAIQNSYNCLNRDSHDEKKTSACQFVSARNALNRMNDKRFFHATHEA